MSEDDKPKDRWDKLAIVGQLLSEAVAVLVELAVTDDNAAVSQAAEAVAASVAVGNATVREVAAARFQADPALKQRASQLALVVEKPVEQVEGEATVQPCARGRATAQVATRNCDRESAAVVNVCTNPLPRAATVRATRVFTKWADDPRPWEQSEAAIGRDGDWNVFERTFEENVGADQKRVCAAFRQWSSHRARVARIQVTFTR